MLGPGGPIDAQLSGVARSLLVALARARRPFTRDELAVRWWPDAEPQRARASLSTMLWTLRTCLRDALGREPLATTRDTVAFGPAIQLEIDADGFEAAISRGDDAAAELWYAGPYLRGIAEDEVEAERERLGALYEAALSRLLATDPDPERARRLIAADPYAEIAYRVLIDDALSDGTSAGARAWLRRARTAFAEIGVTPAFFNAEPYRRLAELDAAGTSRTNLGSENTSFFGRYDDLRIIDEALREARVVTILGAGGSGKTRIAREVATRALGTQTSAAWFVDLTAFEGAGAVDEAIASALNLHDDGRTRAETIAAALRDSDSLLVLDNCEHLIEQAAAIVARIARESPLIRILATSREALRIEAETIVPLEGLASDDAAELFLARAKAADRRLVIDEEAIDCARRTVVALDGLPLAIELAAGRVRLDGLQTIADDALRVVGGATGPRDAGQRSQTIAASIEWSVARLDGPAQLLFARLGAFAGTFDIEDCDAVDLDRSRALDRLIDRSLVVRGNSFEPVLRLLAPVRAHARKRLGSDPRAGDALDAYAERINAVALALLEKRGGVSGANAENALDALAGDIERTLERFFSRGQADRGIDLATALTSHWVVRGARGVADRWLTRAESVVADERRRGDLHYARVRLVHDSADTTEIIRLGELARAAYARAGESALEARALNVIGSGYLGSMREKEALLALTRSLELMRIAGDEYGVAVALSNIAICAVTANDLANALVAYEECEAIFDRVAMIQPRIKVKNNIAYCLLMMGDAERCVQATARVMALAESAEHTAMIAFAAGNASVRAVALGRFDEAVELARRVGAMPDASALYVAYGLVARATAAQHFGDEALTRRCAAAARALQRECGQEFEPFESGFLAPLPGDPSEAIERDIEAAKALLRR